MEFLNGASWLLQLPSDCTLGRKKQHLIYHYLVWGGWWWWKTIHSIGVLENKKRNRTACKVQPPKIRQRETRAGVVGSKGRPYSGEVPQTKAIRDTGQIKVGFEAEKRICIANIRGRRLQAQVRRGLLRRRAIACEESRGSSVGRGVCLEEESDRRSGCLHPGHGTVACYTGRSCCKHFSLGPRNSKVNSGTKILKHSVKNSLRYIGGHYQQSGISIFRSQLGWREGTSIFTLGHTISRASPIVQPFLIHIPHKNCQGNRPGTGHT